ncbi:MAG: glycerate kinase [Betaproteobacteria bacterium]|jgi:hydroxypyruvate reductase
MPHSPDAASEPRAFLRSLFDAAVAAVDPARIVPRHLDGLPRRHRGRTVVLGAGKASAAMAQAVERCWDGPIEGLVVTRYGHALPCERIEIVEAAHPVPDAAGLAVSRRMMELARSLTADDRVIALISGGGSALLTLPADGISFEDKRAVNAALLKSGANIGEMNCVRRHLSAITGGRLGAACGPASVLTLVLSDVPTDDPAVVASGPTIADTSTVANAIEILRRYKIELPPAVQAFLAARAAQPVAAPTALGPREHRMIATAQHALEAAAAVARAAGIAPLILGGSIEGESRDVALVHAGIARQIAQHGQPARAPAVILSGGETTVTVRGDGRGGRNMEFALALAIALDGAPGIHALACDTDGIDGVEDAAGSLIAPDTLTRMRAVGIDPRAALARNDAYPPFAALGDLVVTGPTHTNVNDFRAILIQADQDT